MKKILYGMMAATMIFATSCENELELGAAGEESMVSFTIATPDMGSRADYSDGTTATVLQYAVYDAEGNELEDLTVTNGEIHGSTTVNLKLTTGNTYSVIFWAAAPNAPYTVDFANKTMTVDYTNAVSNDESRDAFYAKETFTVTGAQTETISLKRPFAQLNIGTSDYAASTSAGYTPTKSKVVVSNVYGKLDLWEGDVDSSVVASFDFAAIDTTELFPVSGFKYLAMNYALVSKDKETVDVEFTYTNGSNAKTRTVGSVPVQRNYRTNIYGNILTSDVDINVTIDPEYNEPANNVETIVYNATELQAALDAAEEGTTTIRLATDVEGEVTLAQKPNTEVVFDGGGNTFSGVLTIDGKSATITTAGFTVKNLKFTAPVSRAAASSDACIRLGDGTNATRYTCNVTVENCIFDAPGLVGVKSYTGGDKNLTITNCTATENAHSLVQAKGIDGVVVKKCEVQSKNGMNFNNSDNVTVEECTVDVRGYAVRFGESKGGTGAKETYLIKNCSLKSANEDGDAVIILRGTADYSTLTIENTTIEGDPQITNTATDAKVKFKFDLEDNFADESWEKIALACQNDCVPESWKVGDKKSMTIDGKEYQIAIIGKNHDNYTEGGKAPLTFQLANVYGTTAKMNETQTNTTGWSGSAMRTKTMSEILEVIPVKDAIKAVNKETLNGERNDLETTSDKLFLLSEIEVNGSVFFSNNFAEGERYAYYANGGSTIMESTWWLRGPGKSNNIGFTQINKSGYMANGSAEYACGVVFGFCF